MKKIFLVACLSLASTICVAQNRETAAQQRSVEPINEQLLSCVKKNDAGCVAGALAAGADANATSKEGRAILFFAAEGKSVEIVRLLLSARADVNRAGQGEGTPLCRAALFGRAEIAETLVEAGAKVNVVCDGDHGDTPLMEALRGAWFVSLPSEMSEEIIGTDENDGDGRNSDANAEDETKGDDDKLRDVLKAPRDSFIRIARLLIRRDANVNEAAKCGENALMYAALSADVEMVKELIAGGADVQQSAPLLVLLKQAEHEYGKAQYLALPALSKEQSAMIAWSNKTRPARKEIIELLKAAGAKETEDGEEEKAEEEDKTLEEAAYEAADEAFTGTIKKNDVRDLERLINAYIAHPLGESVLPEALRTAIIYNRTEIVKLLLARGVNPNTTRHKPLMHAVNNSNLEYVLMLLKAGADVNATDDEGLTALDYAEKWTNPSDEHRAIIEALKEHGARSKNQQ